MAAESPVEQSPPADLAEAGARLWRSIVGPFDLDEHERAVLLAACRTADLLDRLADAVAAGPVTVTTAKGDIVAAPAVVESRQQSLALARLLAALRVPAGDESDRPQRRGGARGTYAPSRRGDLRALGVDSA